MFKPEEIKNITFEQSVFSGYKKEAVDEFLDKLYEDYSRLFRENGELLSKLKVCVTKIEEYRADEKFLQSAIVNAQKLNENALYEIETKRKDSEENTRKQAEEIIAQAKEKAAAILGETEDKISAVRENSIREFAEKQQELRKEFEQKKAEFDQQLLEKEAELSALVREVESFRLTAMQVLEKEADLLRQLPKVERVIQDPVVEQVLEPEETNLGVEETLKDEPEIVEESAEESVSQEENAFEVVEEPVFAVPEIENIEEESVEKTAEESNESSDESLVEESAFVTNESNDDEQVSIDDVLTPVVSSPVEPLPPVISETDEEVEEDTNPFDLFGGSSLIFPEDIDEEDESLEEEKDKNNRFRKKLKFGVNFDVKKDK